MGKSHQRKAVFQGHRLGGAPQPIKAQYRGGIINCNASPSLLTGFSLKDRSSMTGPIPWNPSKIRLWIAEGQQGGKSMLGFELKKELASMNPLPANFLDFLIDHPDYVPKEMLDKLQNGHSIFFWGDTFIDSDKEECVRCLSWFSGLKDSFDYVAKTFDDQDLAILWAS